MNTKHTPGPWKVRPRGNEQGQDDGAFVSVMPNGDGSQKWHGYNICSIYSPQDHLNKTRPTEEQLANAKLIAAAPELLELVTTLFVTMKNNGFNGGHWKKHLDKMEAAIKKATE